MLGMPVRPTPRRVAARIARRTARTGAPQRIAILKTAVLVPALLLALAGCQNLLRSPGADAQAIVDRRALGVSAGEFFQRYGPPRRREEASDGTLSFTWEGGLELVPAGVYGPEELICGLNITTDRRGRIVAAPIVRDGKGQRRASRCAELFE